MFTGLVNGTPADPYINIPFDTGVTGSFGNPIAGQSVWFGSTSGGKERGVLRLRSFPGGASGTLVVAESDDVGPQIQNNDFITIKNEFRLWPKYPRFIQNGAIVTIFEDYDTAYTNQLNQWRPKAVAGPPGVAFLSGGSATISFVGDQSQAHAPGATISSYLWTARGSSEGTSSSQGTEGSPVVFTWTSPGRYLVTLQVTDSNGQTDTQHTWAIIENPDSRSVSFVDFDTVSDSFDFNQGGGEVSFVVRETDASVSDFPEESMIILVARGTITTATGSWPFRTNVLFVGWILSDSVRQNPETGDVSFRAATVDAIMKNVTMFPVSLTDTASPVNWTQALSLTVDRAASYLYLFRSTMGLMTPIVFSGYTQLIRRQDFGPSDLYSQVQNELMRSVHGAGRIVCTHQGVLYHEIDHNIKTTSERASVTTRKTLHKGIWVGDISIEERHDYSTPVNQVKMSGIHYPGGQIDDICPTFSEAPGDAPKVYGKETNFDRLIVVSSADLNARSGLMLAKMTERYPIYRMQFINDGSFTTAPQELFPANIESGDNDRGLSFTGNLVPRRISRQYNHQGGYFVVSVDFEPETTGPAGVTVDMPCGPPDQELSTSIPDPPAGIPGLTALIAGTTGSSFYFEPGIEKTWQRRVSGLSDPSQLGFLDILPDPWSTFKQGYSPERVIAWGSGRGFLVRTKDSGKDWTSRGENITPVGWPNETAPDLSEVDLIKLQGDIFSEDRLYVLARWQETGAYHGAVAKSTDGFAYDWHNLTGSSQVRPLGMSVDRGNGTSIYVTTWEADTTGIHLRRLDTSDMTFALDVKLAGATSAEIDANTYFATPFNRNAQANEVFIFGNLFEPQDFTGNVHVLQNTSQGVTGSYSVIENTWASDLAGSFGADDDDYYYAVRNSTSGGGSLGGTLDITEVLPATIIITGTSVGVAHLGNMENDDDILLWHNNSDEAETLPLVSVSVAGSPALSSVGEGLTRGGGEMQSSQFSTDLLVFTYKASNDIYLSGIDNTGDPPVQEGNDATNKDIRVFDSNVANLGSAGVAGMSSNRVLVSGYIRRSTAPSYRHESSLYSVSTSPSISFTLLDNDQYETSAGAPGWDDEHHYLLKLTSTKAVVAYNVNANIGLRAMTTTSDVITTGALFTISSENLIADVFAVNQGSPLQRIDDDTFMLVTDTSIHILSVSGTTISSVTSSAYSVTGTAVDVSLQLNNGVGVGVIISASTDGAKVDLYAIAFHANTTSIEIGTESQIVDNLLSDETAGIEEIGNNIFAVFWHNSGGGDDDIYVMKISVDSGAAGNARFYQGLQTLTERFTLPFAAVQPAAFTLDKSLGTVVMAANAVTAQPVIYSTNPYVTGTSSSLGYPTGSATYALKWV